MKRRYILVLTVLLLGMGYGQGLYYEGLKHLMELGNERYKQDQFLTEKGYEFVTVEKKEGTQIFKYRGRWNNYYKAELIYDEKIKKLMVVEIGSQVLLEDTWNKQLKELGFEFMSDYTIGGAYGVIFRKDGYLLTQEKNNSNLKIKIEKKDF